MHGVSLVKRSIESLLEDFYKVTGIRIAFVSYDQNLWIEVPGEKATFCSLLRSNASFDQKCRSCDKVAFKAAGESGELYLYECHAGLTEAVSPILYEGKLLGYLMLGQTLDKNPDGKLWEQMRDKYSDYALDFSALEKAFYQLRCLDRETLQSAARIMDISAKYIHSSKLAKLKEPQLMEKIKAYTEENLHKSITVADLSGKLSLSASYLSHIIKANLSLSFTEYLASRRVEKAKLLLEHSSMKIHEIADEVGFEGQNYFARIFKKHTGMSPTEFRILSTK